MDGKLKFTVEELVDDIISPFPGIKEIIGSETKKAVKRTLIKVMGNLRKKKPNYFEWDRTEKIWRIDDKLDDPNFQQLTALHNLINEKEKNVSEDQMTIFERDNQKQK